MRKSWKSSLCGILGIFFLGASKTPGAPPWAAHLLELVGCIAPSVGLMFCRDNKVTSEDVGISGPHNGEVTLAHIVSQQNKPKP